ncbi:Gfo/Idh/MocA family protein [Pedosphaera parvula]|uniref:Oxidoreductase domain protein n=1 Tax=Pedosphaera parvula (strain Ellin514) TaxID=320771 RepID=B9XND9_PEDPL|nr:oxidoreductase domain protein [Pedosphaera parvula Ellin514]
MELNLYPPQPRRKDFRIGILGSGFIVNDCHLVAYRKAGFNPVAIASRTLENAQKVALRHGVPKVCNSYDHLLDDPSIEVLDIAVPPHAQLELIRKACARKTAKGILAQKPLGQNLAEAQEAVQLCEAAGILLAVNQNMRYDHSVRAAKTLLDNGTIGEPVIATIEMRGIPHWQPWQAELGWVTLRIMSIHHLDTFRYWFGEPERIYCSTRPDPRTKFPHSDGICTYILEYAKGLRCVGIDDTWTGPAREGCVSDEYIKWRIEGLNGLAIGSIGWCHNPYTTPSTIQYASKGHHGFQAPVWPESWFPDAFVGPMADLLLALENGGQPSTSGYDNLKTMALIDAAYVSAREHLAISPKDVESGDAMKSWRNSSKFQSAWVSNFTPRAQRVLANARKEASRFRHGFVGTEHLLLGLINLGQGTAFTVLSQLGMSFEAVRLEVEKHLPMGPEQSITETIPYSPRTNKVLSLAAREAKALDHTYVGTEHILLGLLQEGAGVGAIVLKKFGVDAAQTRSEILKVLKPDKNKA